MSESTPCSSMGHGCVVHRSWQKMGSRRRRGARSLAGSGKTGVPFTGRERERRRWLQQTVMQFALDVA